MKYLPVKYKLSELTPISAPYQYYAHRLLFEGKEKIVTHCISIKCENCCYSTSTLHLRYLVKVKSTDNKIFYIDFDRGVYLQFKNLNMIQPLSIEPDQYLKNLCDLYVEKYLTLIENAKSFEMWMLNIKYNSCNLCKII